MILPQKHITLSESLFGFGGYILELLSEPKSIDMLWEEFSYSMEKGEYPFGHSFDNLVLVIDYLYIIDAIKIDRGRIFIK
ncbi:hypothetical protein COD21_02320 [Bacillus cereus]|uniref:ABC-three component system middle component 6 n=1 Tax=Bacillus cereus TaxID=1396 RepID=UPI000BFD0895|nr:ABC-three component system middle component 6 [Bacillus cereus]PGU13421.1 hypothetical protein COD21_02320 [Bacillus cereus]